LFYADFFPFYSTEKAVFWVSKHRATQYPPAQAAIKTVAIPLLKSCLIAGKKTLTHV